MMCDFRPGDEVVCVDDAQGRVEGFQQPWLSGPDRGCVYNVSDVFCDEDGVICVRLKEIQNTWVATGEDVGWRASRFRKVQRRNLTEWLSQKTKFEEPKRIGENA